MIHTDTGLEEGHCGLVPVGETCQSCSTTGLTWNLGEPVSSRGLYKSLYFCCRQSHATNGWSDQHK